MTCAECDVVFTCLLMQYGALGGVHMSTGICELCLCSKNTIQLRVPPQSLRAITSKSVIIFYCFFLLPVIPQAENALVLFTVSHSNVVLTL